ncbi:MAG: biotin carboxylase N-terminal domain-containing protein, partial [Myxococcota bacterium]|nr:biotin carboxylase N-terminal domain-containing protein [Myxococcota bacterium]
MSDPRPIRCVLVANRGEIAARIARTCGEEGIRTVGVYTEADQDSPHGTSCDTAERITDYLDGDAIVRAAHRAGADAVHPGYGFLAENEAFAQQVVDAGLVWIGPPASAIAAMGSKAAARQLMAEAGVAVVPGYDGEAQDTDTLTREAERIGYPILVKASAGGGGKGMSIVRDADGLAEAAAGAQRLAQGAFGDGRLILERYLERPRHIEVQVLADSHGTCLHLFERECSIQRRHQKVIEEAPSPLFGDPAHAGTRQQLYDDAVRAAQAVGYVGAGTVEFIVDEAGRHHFLEMNTR